MFYLEKWWHCFLKNKPHFIMFWGLSLFLLILGGQEKRISNVVNNLFLGEDKTPSHFFALIDGKKNLGYIKRKMAALPGVDKIEEVEEEKIKKTTEEIILNWKSKVPSSFLEKKFFGIKIVFSETASAKAMKLIKDYLIRLVGQKYVSTTTISGKGNAKKSRSVFWLKDSFPIVLNLILISFNLLLVFLVMMKLRPQFYFLDLGQRRKFVGLKSWIITGGCLFVLLSIPLMLSSLTSPLSFACLFLSFLIGSLVFSRGYQWGS